MAAFNFNINTEAKDYSLLSLANIEALADIESGGSGPCTTSQSSESTKVVCPSMGYTIWVDKHKCSCTGNSGGQCEGLSGHKKGAVIDCMGNKAAKDPDKTKLNCSKK
ncbi:MAG: hypothetical protein ACK5KT_08350 [Dysgonomonas sp.]